jgi:hypothetical protein
MGLLAPSKKSGETKSYERPKWDTSKRHMDLSFQVISRIRMLVSRNNLFKIQTGR